MSFRYIIVMLSSNYPPFVGGSEQQAHRLGKALRQRGHRVEVVTRAHTPHQPLDDEYEGIPVHRVPVSGPLAMRSVMYHVGALRAIREIAVRERRTGHRLIFHSHQALSTARIAVLAKWLYGGKAISKVACSGAFGELKGHRPWASLLPWLDRMVLLNDESVTEMAELGLPDRIAVKIPNGIDTEAFSPVGRAEREALRTSFGWPADEKVVVFGGRLSAQKGLKFLLEAWAQVGRFPGRRLVILGEGPEAAELLLKVRALGLSNVEMPGSVQTLLPHLRAADLMVLPSLSEGLPNVLLEAGACALPAVVTRVGAIPTVVPDASCGWVVTPGQVLELTAALEEGLNHPDQLPSVGRALRDHIVQHFSLDSVATRYEELYEDLWEEQKHVRHSR